MCIFCLMMMMMMMMMQILPRLCCFFYPSIYSVFCKLCEFRSDCRCTCDLCRRPTDIPWLYYQESASSVLSDTSITTNYHFPNSKLGLLASVFHSNGSFLGYRSVTGGLLQLCKSSDAFMDAAYVFGTTYQHSVNSVIFFSKC